MTVPKPPSIVKDVAVAAAECKCEECVKAEIEGLFSEGGKKVCQYERK
jgi:hypothetical protein